MWNLTQFFITLCACGALASAATAATVDFEPPTLALGDEFGPAVGDVPGDLAFVQDNIAVYLDQFSEGGVNSFNSAIISGQPGPPQSYFPPALNPTRTATLNNIAFRFDFTSLPYPVTALTFDYVDLGGTENLNLNLLGRQELAQFSDATSYGHHLISVSENVVSGGVTGTVTVTSEVDYTIDTLLVGGQELGIDNVNAVPEPGTLSLLGVATLLAGRRRV